MKKILITASLLAVIGSFGSCEAALQYWGTDGGNWDTPAHWVSGNATAAGDGVQINAGRTANITTVISPRTAITTIGNNAGGTSSLIVQNGGMFGSNTGGNLYVGGTAASSSDGIFTVQSGGQYEGIRGDLEIGNTTANGGAGNTGTVTFESGSTLDFRNGNLNINQGLLRIESGVTIDPYLLKNDFSVQDGGTLEFQTAGSSVSTLNRGNSTVDARTLILAAGSTLSLELTGTHSVGDSWTLIQNTDIFTGTFGTITDSTEGHEGYVFTADYGDAVAGELTVTLTAIPEPATIGMVAAFGGGLLFIRRRMLI